MSGDLHTRANVDVLLLERLHDDIGDVRVEAGKDLGQALQDGHRRTEIGEARRKLATDCSATDHCNSCRNLVQHQHFVGCHDRTTNGETRNRAGHGSGCQNHIGSDQRTRRTIGRLYGHGSARPERAGAKNVGDLLALRQTRQTLHQTIDDGLLAGLRDRKVHRRSAGLHSKVLCVGNVPKHRRTLEKRLCRNTTPVEARSTDGVLFHQGNGHPG